ncbi:MAG TPA: hypothetical protein VIK59_07935 [Verrucomicrobiae bacterium]
MARKTVKELIAPDNVDVVEIRDWITSASIPELKEFIHTAGRWTKYSILSDRAREEIAIRAAEASERTHWTVTPGFIVGVLAMVFAGIAAWPIVREWFHSAPFANTVYSSPPPQTNLAPVILPAPKTSASQVRDSTSLIIKSNSP